MPYDFLLYILSAIAFVTAIICFIVKFARNKKDNMVFNKQYFWVVDLITLFASVMLCVFCAQKESFNTLMVFTLMTTLGFVGCIAWHNEIIVFEDKYFTVKNFLGIKKVYHYSDITGVYVRRGRNKYFTETKVRFYVGKRSFTVLSSAVNYTQFFKRINDEYKKNKGRNLPKVR